MLQHISRIFWIQDFCLGDRGGDRGKYGEGDDKEIGDNDCVRHSEVRGLGAKGVLWIGDKCIGDVSSIRVNLDISK